MVSLWQRGMAEGESYRLLRFELPSFAVFLYVLMLLAPFLLRADISQARVLAILSVAGTIFVASIPIGYLIHQFYVNKYRRKKTKRPSHALLELWINGSISEEDAYRRWTDEKRFTFIDSMLAFSYAVSKESCSKHVSNSLSTRWSHFYARCAIGWHSLVVSAIIVAAVVLLSEYAFSLGFFLEITCVRVAVSLCLFVAFLIVLLLMNSYIRKLLDEISMIEVNFLLCNEEAIRKHLVAIRDKTGLFIDR